MDISFLLSAACGLLTVGIAYGRLDNKIKQLENRVKDIEARQIKHDEHAIIIAEIKTKLDFIISLHSNKNKKKKKKSSKTGKQL